MTKRMRNNLISLKCVICAAIVFSLTVTSSIGVFALDAPTAATQPTSATTEINEELATDAALSELQEQYDEIESQINQGKHDLEEIESGKSEQNKNIEIIESDIDKMNEQIDILNERIGVLDKDISTLNSSINNLSSEISILNSDIKSTEDKIDELNRKNDILYAKIRGRLILDYMSGHGSTLRVLLGVTDLPEFLIKLEIIKKLNNHETELIDEFSKNIEELDSLNINLSNDKTTVDSKKSQLDSEKATLADRQSDLESSSYVLEMKKQISEHKYQEAVAYFKTLDDSSSDYNAMLKLLSDEQERVDAEIDAYLLKYGSSAEDGMVEETTSESGDGDSTTESTTKKQSSSGGLTSPQAHTGTVASETETESEAPSVTATMPSTTKINVITPESIKLIWPLPYKNCYISAPFGQYPSGGVHRGLDICVRGGTLGKNVVAAADGKVINYGFNHWSMGNYIIIDHGYGLFTAYYHLQTLYVAGGDSVEQGQVIGLAGSTGNSTGPHLHFEVRINRNGAITRVDPLKFVSMP
ncbi:MAG: peptidoglycan DD-metalloendopeptidase family protein [Clostridia bacterium]|nr:peptidoglycan DD-metalloendopeptidase family protein [Clostridia bacterium]